MQIINCFFNMFGNRYSGLMLCLFPHTVNFELSEMCKIIFK